MASSLAINHNNDNRVGRTRLYNGHSAFATTDTTATIHTSYKVIEDVLLSYKGTCAVADGPLSWSASGGVVTVSRVAGTTSAAAFSFLVIGH